MELAYGTIKWPPSWGRAERPINARSESLGLLRVAPAQRPAEHAPGVCGLLEASDTGWNRDLTDLHAVAIEQQKGRFAGNLRLRF